jgi:hypothetical protein
LRAPVCNLNSDLLFDMNENQNQEWIDQLKQQRDAYKQSLDREIRITMTLRNQIVQLKRQIMVCPKLGCPLAHSELERQQS